jgi:hypothetical protein
VEPGEPFAKILGVPIELVGETAQLIRHLRRAHRDTPQLDGSAPQKPDLALQRSTDLVVGHPLPLPTANTALTIT